MAIAIIVHGGAGSHRTDDSEEEARSGCLSAARAGFAVLEAGGTALDAVEAAVVALEEDPQFNAGRGACLNQDGEIELDASIMSGADLRAGAVALVRDVRNPIRLARAVMERTHHVFLAGEGASRLAYEAGLERVDPSWFITDRSRRRWDEAHGTVGAVAIDRHFHLAAATSTGGTIMKRKGRIGDTPLIGCGTFADDETGAASATGHGEAFIRVGLARTVCERLRAADDPRAAARAAIATLSRVHGEGGLIVVDRLGRVGASFNTARMSHAWIDARGNEGSAFHPARPET
jgi:beta-aspartyl-peptidase (threonine type)